MSREDAIVLPCLSAVPIWTFGILPLHHEGTSMLSIVSFVVSLLAMAGTLANAWINRKNQRETTAKNNFREFLKLCVANPKFAYGDPDGRQGEYEWFVAHFLWAAEEILEFAPRDWEENLKLHVGYHRSFLQTDARFQREDLPTYTPKLRRFLERTLRDLPTNAGAIAVVAVSLPIPMMQAVDNWAAAQPAPAPQRDQAIQLLTARGLNN